ncbi:hypothetical protein B484DRAFT_135519 [Ochromonadaceae sp. CCMP2298]|nr:hypothetical protein B484DRAFT_135519 [Ochromonadaceae sp. CCMP2298]
MATNTKKTTLSTHSSLSGIHTTMPSVAEDSGRGGARRACSGSMPTGPASTPAPAPSTCMQDEYGDMDSSGHTAVVEDFQLECGERLQAAACYNTFGVLSASRDNVIVVCHALTGNSRLDQWWGGLLGPGLAFDTDRYFIVCFNVLGSCYGSSGPR